MAETVSKIIEPEVMEQVKELNALLRDTVWLMGQIAEGAARANSAVSALGQTGKDLPE